LDALLLLELDVSNQISSAFDTLSEVNVTSRSNCDYVGVFTKRLECDWVMDFPRAFAGVMQLNEIIGFQGLFSDWIRVIMLSEGNDAIRIGARDQSIGYFT
jgi:hypothetical protein